MACARLLVEGLRYELIKYIMITEDAGEACELILDFYPDEIEYLKLETMAKNQPEGRIEPIKAIIDVLQSGLDTCEDWETSSECLKHFDVLDETIRKSMEVLNELAKEFPDEQAEYLRRRIPHIKYKTLTQIL